MTRPGLAAMVIALAVSGPLPGEVRTLWLRAIEREAAARTGDPSATLEGLTDIKGYRWNNQTKDIGIIGGFDTEDPPILVDEFAMALRIRDRIGAGMTLIPKVFQDIRSPQQVHSFPPEIVGSAFERALVEADYLGKRLAFDALVARHRDEIKVCRDAPRPQRQNSPARIMFLSAPPKFVFETSENGFTVHFTSVDVVLKAESGVFHAAGTAAHTLAPDDPVAEFAARLTKDLPQLARKEPIFRRMHNMFKLFLLAQTLHRDPEIAYDFGFWDRYASARLANPRELPSYQPVVLKRVCWGRPYEYSAVAVTRQIYGGVVIAYSDKQEGAPEIEVASSAVRAGVGGRFLSSVHPAALSHVATPISQLQSLALKFTQPPPPVGLDTILVSSLASALYRSPAVILGHSGLPGFALGPARFPSFSSFSGYSTFPATTPLHLRPIAPVMPRMPSCIGGLFRC